jgi:hypothetical protein
MVVAGGSLAAHEGVQMHGGMGMSDLFDIDFFMKRARSARSCSATPFHADQLARTKSY